MTPNEAIRQDISALWVAVKEIFDSLSLAQRDSINRELVRKIDDVKVNIAKNNLD